MTPGTRLGPYEIVAPLGEGGMGEVHKATDTRLGRVVAIKVLPPHWMDDADMQARFKQEAQTIASLNHPNICALHDVGSVPIDEVPVTYLVMELLEGETLAARLERGPLDLDDALDIAIPIADALDQAHRRGVVHRDLKPANVMLTPNGPKLLDFGIAKTMTATDAAGQDEPAPNGGSVSSGSQLTRRPMPTTPLTTPGLVIGTLQYMAPEQIEGLEADARTDIFAFGAMLHEMVTGKKAFEAKSQVLLISAIATSEPPALSSVQPKTPAALDQVVKACMAKDPDDRWQTARDLLAELRWIADGGAASSAVVPLAAARRGRGRLVRVLLATAAVLGLAMAAPAARYLSGWAAPGELRYLIPFNGAIGLSQSPLSPNGRDAISPDGTMLAFFARPTSSTVSPSSLALHVSQVGALTHEPFPGSEGGSQPFWSADGLSIGYVAGDRIWKVDASGGPPQDVAEAQGFMGGAWNADGTILFGSATGIFRVPAEGGTAEPVTTPGDSETGHFWPRFLPDGQRFLYLAWSSDASARAVFVGSLDGTPAVRVMPAESNAIYTRSETSGRGYLVFHRGPIVYAQPFDADSLTLSGEPGRLADDIDHNPATGRGQFDVSATGVLAYYFDDLGAGRFSSTGADSWQWLAVWADMSTGQVVAPVGWEGMIRGVEVSPDGTRVAMHRHEEKGGDLWVIEPNGTRRHITFDLAEDASGPIWSPTGDDLVYSAYRNGQWGLYRTRSDGSGVAELLYASDLRKVPTSWSRDGRIVFWQEDPETAGDLWMLPVPATPQGTGGAAALELEPQPILKSPADERYGQVSPDGRWLAYVSDEIERGVFHVYVRPFPSGSGLYQISTLAQPGDRPRWSRDGRTLFFMEAMPSGATLRSATLFASAMGANRDALVYEPPRPVLGFTSFNLEHPGGPYPAYDVSPDPARMLVFQRYFADATAPSTTAAPVLGVDTQSGLVIARHWDSAIEKEP